MSIFVGVMRRVKAEDEGKSRRSLRVPSEDIAVGGVFIYAGEEFEVVESVAELPRDACFGCAFSGAEDEGRYKSCPNVRCSGFDRSDRRFVWFVRRDR